MISNENGENSNILDILKRLYKWKKEKERKEYLNLEGKLWKAHVIGVQAYEKLRMTKNEYSQNFNR